MKNSVMQKEIVDAYKHRYVRENGLGINGTGGTECIVFCKKVTPHIFDIKDGFAVLARNEEFYKDGVCMISNFTKVVFVFDQTQESR